MTPLPHDKKNARGDPPRNIVFIGYDFSDNHQIAL